MTGCASYVSMKVTAKNCVKYWKVLELVVVVLQTVTHITKG